MRVSGLRAAATAAALFVGGAVIATADDPPPAAAPNVDAAGLDEARRKSSALAEKDDFAGALDVLKDAARRLGRSAALTTSEGRVFLMRAQYESVNGTDGMLVRALYADAAIRAKQALEMDAGFSDAVTLLATVLCADGDAEGARAALTGWVEKHPQDTAVRVALANLLFTSRDWSGADLQYTKCLETDPANGIAKLNQTVARQWMGIPAADLEKGYLDAARLLPDEDRPLSLLAGLHPKERDKKLELLGRVVADNPRAVWARVWIAFILRKEDPTDAAKALATLRDAEKIAPDNAQVHSHLAQVLEESGANASALDEYTLAVEKGAPGAMANESDAIDRLLHVTPGNDKIPLAARERSYDAVCAKNPQDGRYGNNAGLWFRDVAKDYAKSLKYYLASVKAAPDEQDFVNDAALIYLFHLTDRRDECRPMFEHVLRLVEKDGQPPQRGYWDTLENLCKYWFDAGDWKKTIEYADKRASRSATMNGRPYPSMKAALYKAQALAKIEKAKK